MEYTAANLKARCEQGREVGRPTNTRLSATGKPYFVIGSQEKDIPLEPGTVNEGEPKEWAFDEETAYFMALNCFENYAHEKSGKLYWRIEPKFERHPKKPRQCAFYMRCLISDKPEVS